MPPTPEFCMRDTNMLVYFGLPPTPIPDASPNICVSRRQTPDAKPKICISPDAKPRRQSVEYRLRWVPTQNAGVGHVYFMFFVYISFAFGTQREPKFRWNMGFRIIHKKNCCCSYIYLKKTKNMQNSVVYFSQ